MIAALSLATTKDDRTRLMDGIDFEAPARAPQPEGRASASNFCEVYTSAVARSDIHGTRAAVLRHAFSIAKEAARHLLRRPVAGVALAAHDEHGRWLLIRRSDTGAWAFVGGTLEWGETMRVCAERELQEEAGARLLGIEAIVGVYTDPARDPRFHAATTVLRCLIASDVLGARNPLEIRGVRFVSASELRALARDGSLSHGMGDMAEAALSDGPPVIE